MSFGFGMSIHNTGLGMAINNTVSVWSRWAWVWRRIKWKMRSQKKVAVGTQSVGTSLSVWSLESIVFVTTFSPYGGKTTPGGTLDMKTKCYSHNGYSSQKSTPFVPCSSSWKTGKPYYFVRLKEYHCSWRWQMISSAGALGEKCHWGAEV